MKRSRIFLGLTTGALAIAGAVAAKASHKGVSRDYYITSGAAQTCVFTTSPCAGINDHTKPVCKTDGGSGSYYTQRTTINNKKCVVSSLKHYTAL